MAPHPADLSPVMDCAELARTLDAFLDHELAPEEEAEARAHADSCEACRERVAREAGAREALRAALRSALGPQGLRGRAPDALRERIHLALARERRPVLRRLLAPLPLGALAACAAGALVVLYTQRGPDPLVEEAVRKHTRDLPLEVTAAAAGPESIARWFSGKLDFNPAPPQFRERDVRLVGARLSNIQDRPAAYVRYELPRGHLGLFILDDPDHRFLGAGHLVRAGPASVRLINARGFNVAVWRRNEIVYSLVSDLDEADLARLVRTVQGLEP